MLGLATVGFALTFWAWALLSPLGAHFKQALGLSSFQQALVAAVPVIVAVVIPEDNPDRLARWPGGVRRCCCRKPAREPG
jgi:hypothetical protein